MRKDHVSKNVMDLLDRVRPGFDIDKWQRDVYRTVNKQEMMTCLNY